MTSRLTIILVLTSINLFGQLDKRTYEVYSTIIKEEFILRNDTVNNLVLIYKGTIGQQITETIDVAIESVEAIQSGQPVFLSYADSIHEVLRQNPQIGQLVFGLKRNNKNNKLGREFDLNCTYSLITKKRFEGLIKNNRLNKLKEKDSRLFGMIEFSNVVFDGDYAAVYCGFYIRTLNAVGRIMILKREGKKWRIVSRPEFWVS